MSIKIFDFADGFTSSTAPSPVGIESSGFTRHADDSAYVTAEGTAQDGDAYYNTTINKVKIYEDGNWVENASFEA